MMLRIFSAKRLPLAQSLLLAGVSLAVISLPSYAQDTVVRKVLMTNDGITETTTTTSTTPGVVDRVLVPASTVDRVFIEKPVTIADQVVTTKEVVSSPGSSTTTTTTTTIDGNVFRTTLQEREKGLRAVIATGVADGTLTDAQAARYRAELDRLSALEVYGGTVTYDKLLPVAYEYDLLGRNLKVVNYTPYVQGTRFIVSDAHVVQIDDLMNRRAGLEAKISYGLVNGKLTSSEADRLRGMLNHVAVVENGFRADGNISDKEAKDLYSEFDKIGSAIDKEI
ncbi:MAG: hypothetical protein SGJ27_25835 [Candidatus Melainabacteria bacterium]|nr:hypothetical protein [Candidatus Melainabacteria bacterium]